MKQDTLNSILDTDKKTLLELVPTPSNRNKPLTAYDYEKTNIFYVNPDWYKVVITLSGKCGDSKKRAAKMGFEFDLDLLYLVELWLEQEGRCKLTGTIMEFDAGIPTNKNFKSVSIDRIDNNEGYVKGNVRLLSHWANNAKSTWGHDVFETMVKNAAKQLLNEKV